MADRGWLQNLTSQQWSRRDFLVAAGLMTAGGALASCSSEPGAGGSAGASATGTSAAPKESFTTPTKHLSGDLKILMWSHFVPMHDKWFDPFVKQWGDRVGVNVTVDHVDNAQIPARIAAEIQAGQGHDLIQYIATLSQFEPGVLDLKDVTEEANKRWGQQIPLCQKSSQNPTTGKYYAYAPGWVPDPGDYRKSLWEPVGFANGPSTWDELLQGGAEIKKSKGVQMGLGMSQEIDSNMAGRALLWSFGGAIQNDQEQVVINSPETIAAVEFMAKLFQQTMTNEVFSWNAASNNQGLIAGKLSYILNSISAYRTAQTANPDVAADVSFVPALKGPKTALAAEHVMYNWIVPSFAKNADAAKEFLLHYTENWASVTYHSQLYDFPAWDKLVPELDGWLAKDPFGSKPADKLAFLSKAKDWSTNIGHPGPSNTAIGEVFGTFVIPNMFARAARGQQSPQQTVAQAETEIKSIFDKWRSKGLVGG
jgi:multiple sugar transport system substrate-binding protein